MTKTTRHYAVIGAGMAGVVCARTLVQAGHRVTVFEKSRGAGGRMATRETAFGTFDHGVQYFTVRDDRFDLALRQTAAERVRPWSANAVRVLDAHGRVVAAALPAREQHWVCTPGMNALVRLWAHPLSEATHVRTTARRIERDALNPSRWQIRAEDEDGGVHVHSGFDGVMLAMPHVQAIDLLQKSEQAPRFAERMAAVQVAPCWTLMIAYPQAMQPGMQTLGPQWNAARSTHHRIAWLARESSKPQRGPIERWTVQASPQWSQEHLEDDHDRVIAKMLKAFAEITGIHAQPAHAVAHRWRYAQTVHALGAPFLWDAQQGLGICGDWCLGHRVEDAFVSGLELALAVV